ncbi:MAG: hypothetical protein LBR53_11180 [Deltaproteobacteria bacterium]|nr:hypothetical protein [Deltaproteobacteria bacterium]
MAESGVVELIRSGILQPEEDVRRADENILKESDPTGKRAGAPKTDNGADAWVLRIKTGLPRGTAAGRSPGAAAGPARKAAKL